MKTLLLDRHQTFVQWVSQATGISTVGLKIRLLGNDLHILCEDTDCPKRWYTLYHLLQGLEQTHLDDLTNENQSPIYQVLVYGRKKGEYRPQWFHRIYLNQLDKHRDQAEQALLSETKKSRIPGGSLIVSNESLARQGNPDAIARYLSENLSKLGVAVQVRTQPHQSKLNSQKTGNRLWIFCQSTYTPDPTLLAEPIAQQLRCLKLAGYQDAVIISQVRGESDPDWRSRVDLTPPETMLKEWARWGDIQAITRLLTEVLSDLKITVEASLKEFTLYIFCTPAVDSLQNPPAPEKDKCLSLIISELEKIAPQGILSAVIYGQKTEHKRPTWVGWTSLPATQHPDLATSTLELGATGDQPAIIFLLERLLNQDMDWRLRTGGIRVLLLHKGDLLHVMCESLNCPKRHQIAGKVTQFIRQLKIVGITGVRIYGRRAGDTESVWHHGVDFKERHGIVSGATREFAATAEYIGDLLPQQTNESILKPDLVIQLPQDWLETAHQNLKKSLLATQLFAETNQSTQQQQNEQSLLGSLIWIALGFTLTIQSDWILGYMTHQISQNSPKVSSVSLSSSSPSSPYLTSPKQQDQKTTSLNTTKNTRSSQFGNSTAILSASRFNLPSFNARQLDEQLALYKQRLATNGKPPDVLIIGSSRALRGVDPAALSRSLATQGYRQVDVFNFGVNGSTAKVVDFIIRRILPSSELPKMIIWADGSRAFNSGREDITFNAIAGSKGYQELLKTGKESLNHFSSHTKNLTQDKKNKYTDINVNSYHLANDFLNQALVAISASYENRLKIKTLLQHQLNYLPVINNFEDVNSKTEFSSKNQEKNTELSVNFDGFLPLSIRFNPATYYHRHPRVTGAYDNDYKDFQLAGDQDAALKSIIHFTKEKQISLVFINMPLTADYMDSVRLKYEQEFQKYMLNVSRNHRNFIYRDLSQIWLKENHYFSDPSHLNRYGAYEVSKKLAIDLKILWTVK